MESKKKRKEKIWRKSFILSTFLRIIRLMKNYVTKEDNFKFIGIKQSLLLSSL